MRCKGNAFFGIRKPFAYKIFIFLDFSDSRRARNSPLPYRHRRLRNRCTRFDPCVSA
jgi:hypothetical protein